MSEKIQHPLHKNIRVEKQKELRKNYLEFLPPHIREELSKSDYYVTPEREILIMDLLEKYSHKNVLVRDFKKLDQILQFINNLQRVPENVDVMVWSILEGGPVYKVNLKWLINNFTSLWNSFNKFDLNIISENGRIGLMITQYASYEDGKTYPTEIHFNVKKWGLI